MSSRWNPHVGPSSVTDGRRPCVGGRMRWICNQAAPACCMHWALYIWENTVQGVVTPATRCTTVGYMATRSPAFDEPTRSDTRRSSRSCWLEDRDRRPRPGGTARPCATRCGAGARTQPPAQREAVLRPAPRGSRASRSLRRRLGEAPGSASDLDGRRQPSLSPGPQRSTRTRNGRKVRSRDAVIRARDALSS
jgi:hypothetical protein